MRITSLYDIKEDFEGTKKKLKESLINDVKKIAETQFKDNKFTNFIIRIRLEEISKEDKEINIYH